MPLLVDVIVALLPVLVDLIKYFGEWIGEVIALIAPILDVIGKAIRPLIKILVELYRDYIKFVIDAFKLLGETSNSVFSYVWQKIKEYLGFVIDYFNEFLDFINNVFAGDWDKAWQNIVNSFGIIFNGIKNLAKVPLNYVIDKINNMIRGINNIKIPDWVPSIGGKSINIPLIPKLAKGGLAFGETLAMVGDNPNARLDPEVIAPLSKLEKMIKFNIDGASGSANESLGQNIARVIAEKMPDFSTLGENIARSVYNALLEAEESKGEEHIHISMDGEDIAFGLEKVKKAKGVELYE